MARVQVVEDGLGVAYALGVVDPHAEVTNVVRVSSIILESVSAPLQHWQQLLLQRAAARDGGVLLPLNELNPHVEWVAAVSLGDQPRLPLLALLLLHFGNLGCTRLEPCVERLDLAATTEGLRILLARLPSCEAGAEERTRQR